MPSGTTRSILRGQRPVIRSDGSLVRDYFHVEDAAAAYILLAEKLAENHDLYGQAFNFSNEKPVTGLEFVKLIQKLMGSTLELDVRNEASNEIRAQYLDATRARHVLGWSSLFTLEEGLQQTIEWYRNFLGV